MYNNCKYVVDPEVTWYIITKYVVHPEVTWYIITVNMWFILR